VLNPQVFEEQRQRPLSDILLESQQVHADLLAHLQHFTDADLARDLQLAHDGEDGAEKKNLKPATARLAHLRFFALAQNDMFGPIFYGGPFLIE
jgi:hypothetical protein